MYFLLQELIGSGKISPHISFHEDISYEINRAEYMQYDLVYGHIGVAWNDAISPGRQWMTMLRDPVDRVLSQYYFWRNMVPLSPHLSYVHAAQTQTLADFVQNQDELLLQGNQDLQTWFLADDFRRRYRRVSEADALAAAKANLRDRFAFIGIFEDYAESVDRLCQLLSRPIPKAIPMENRTLERASAGEINASVIEKIRDLNRLDIELYEYGKQQVQELRTRVSDERTQTQPSPYRRIANQ